MFFLLKATFYTLIFIYLLCCRSLFIYLFCVYVVNLPSFIYLFYLYVVDPFPSFEDEKGNNPFKKGQIKIW
jgi:hypothetical protein